MEQVLQGMHWRSLVLHLNDTIVISSDFQTHLHRLEEVFRRLHQTGLKLKPTKCELFQQEVKNLGPIVSVTGVSTDSKKVATIRDRLPP